MGKNLSIALGIVAALGGVLLLVKWWEDFTFILRGIAPVFLIFGGVLALAAGISELKDTIESKKAEKK